MTPIQLREILKKRNEIAKTYCEKKGWFPDTSKLTMNQLNEIRKLPEWKNPK